MKEILGVPSKVRVVAVLALGYPSGRNLSGIVTTGRKELKDIVCYDKWIF